MNEQPRTRREIREAESRSRGAVGPLSIGALVLVVLAAVLLLGKGLFASDPVVAPGSASGATASLAAASPAATKQSTVTTSEPTPTSTTPATIPDPLAAAVIACREGWAAQTKAVASGNAALTMWSDHIEIMNRLQDGQISLKQAKAEWPATTKGAAAKVAEFRADDAAFKASKATCAPPAGDSSETSTTIRACDKALTSRDSLLVAMRVAIKPWEIHLKDSSHFKSGEITPAAAEAAWRVKWKEGLATLPGYAKSVAATARAKCTLPA